MTHWQKKWPRTLRARRHKNNSDFCTKGNPVDPENRKTWKTKRHTHREQQCQPEKWLPCATKRTPTTGNSNVPATLKHILEHMLEKHHQNINFSAMSEPWLVYFCWPGLPAIPCDSSLSVLNNRWLLVVFRQGCSRASLCDTMPAGTSGVLVHRALRYSDRRLDANKIRGYLEAPTSTFLNTWTDKFR